MKNLVIAIVLVFTCSTQTFAAPLTGELVGRLAEYTENGSQEFLLKEHPKAAPGQRYEIEKRRDGAVAHQRFLKEGDFRSLRIGIESLVTTKKGRPAPGPSPRDKGCLPRIEIWFSALKAAEIRCEPKDSDRSYSVLLELNRAVVSKK